MNKTVRVRITVAVDESGVWAATGAYGVGDGDAGQTCLDTLDSAGYYVIHYIEAELPVPVPPPSKTVEGKVTG